MKYFSFLLASFLMLSLSACMGTAPKPPQKKAPLPEWINAVLPNDTTNTMYGMAIAKNRDLAIKSALSDMISRLGVNIESTYESVEKSDAYHSSLHVKNSIKSEISQIKINNYKVIQSYRISYREFAVMVATDKQKFVAGLRADLEAKKTSLKERENALRGLDSFRKYRAKKVLSEDAKKLLPTLFMIAQLDASYEKKNDLNFVNRMEKSYLKASQKLQFFVHGDRKSQIFVEVIKNDLAEDGFSVSDSRKNALIIKLHTRDRVSSGNIAIITLNISVSEKKSRIGGKTIILKERYNGSWASVYKNASIHLQEDIKSRDNEFYQALTP